MLAPPFLKGGSGEPEQLGQPALELLVGDARVQVAPLERLEHVAATAIVMMMFGEQFGAALIALAQHVGPGEQLELLARAQKILKARRIGALERDRLFGVLEVEQLVAERQVEQPALPRLQPAEPLVGRHLRDHDLLGERRESRRSREAGAPAAVGGSEIDRPRRSPRSSGRIWRARARRDVDRKFEGRPSHPPLRCSAPAVTAAPKRTGGCAVSRVVSTKMRSSRLRRLRRTWTSSTTADEKSSSLSHTPTKACPATRTRMGFRPACSAQAA